MTSVLIMTACMVLCSHAVPYRDKVTLDSSRVAAQFAKVYQAQMERVTAQLKRRSFHIGTPSFHSSGARKGGVRKDDQEIFDFTDSRFVDPPPQNRQNFPLVDTDVLLGNSVENVIHHSKISAQYQLTVKPMRYPYYLAKFKHK